MYVIHMLRRNHSSFHTFPEINVVIASSTSKSFHYTICTLHFSFSSLLVIFPKFSVIFSTIHCKSKDICNVIALASTHIATIAIFYFFFHFGCITIVILLLQITILLLKTFQMHNKKHSKTKLSLYHNSMDFIHVFFFWPLYHKHIKYYRNKTDNCIFAS